MSEFSKRLLALRKRMELSQEELAFKIGTSQKQISKYETGKNEPTANVLHNMAEVLNTTTDYLLGRTNVLERPLRGESDLDKSEEELLALYRRQTPEDRKRILNVIKALALESA